MDTSNWFGLSKFKNRVRKSGRKTTQPKSLYNVGFVDTFHKNLGKDAIIHCNFFSD